MVATTIRTGDIIKHDGTNYFVVSEHSDRFVVFPPDKKEATMILKEDLRPLEVVGHTTAHEWFKEVGA